MLTITKEIKGLRINRLSLPPAQRYRAKLKSNHMLLFCQQNWHYLAYLKPSQATRRIRDTSRVRKASVPRQKANGEGRGTSKQASTPKETQKQVLKIWILVLRLGFPSWVQKETPHREQGAKRPLLLQSVFLFPFQHVLGLAWSDHDIKKYTRRKRKAGPLNFSLEFKTFAKTKSLDIYLQGPLELELNRMKFKAKLYNFLAVWP